MIKSEVLRTVTRQSVDEMLSVQYIYVQSTQCHLLTEGQLRVRISQT